MSGIYPVGVEVAPGGPVARWRPLVSWLLALPFLLWAYLVSYGAVVVVVVAWFAIVLTGRMPGSLGDYLTATVRYQWRVHSYLFGLTERSPGFRLVAGYVDPADHPSVFYSAQPPRRQRATVLFRLVLILPLLLLSYLVVLARVTLLFAGWWTVLVLGRWPVKLRDRVVATYRWQLRVVSYVWLIVDDYPPFRFETVHSHAGDISGLTTVPTADPREAFGPPWPRLVGGDTYSPPRLLRWPIVVSAVLLAGNIASQAIGSPSTGPPGPSSSAQATAPPSTPATIAYPSRPPATAGELALRLLPPPPGYAVVPSLMSANGVITAAGFDRDAGAGSAALLGFVEGCEATYAKDATVAFIDIELLRFSSPQNAVFFQQATTSVIVPGESAKQSAFPAIPRAVAVDGTKPADGAYDHVVIATRGSVVMLVEFTTSAGGPAPPDFAGWAEQQYNRL